MQRGIEIEGSRGVRRGRYRIGEGSIYCLRGVLARCRCTHVGGYRGGERGYGLFCKFLVGDARSSL